MAWQVPQIIEFQLNLESPPLINTNNTRAQELVLDRNRIRYVDPDALSGLPRLRELRLEENGLRSLANLQVGGDEGCTGPLAPHIALNLNPVPEP